MNPVSMRLLSQQLAKPQFQSCSEVVDHFGAIQAQEYRLMRWAVASRTKNPDGLDFKRAFDDGEIVRTHLLRGTWQLVTGRDYTWMHSLCAPSARRTILGWMHANRVDISASQMLELGDVLLRTVESLRSATKEQVKVALDEAGMHLTDQLVSYHLRLQELEGNIVSGDLLPMKATYSLVSGKICPAAQTDRDEALMLLTRKYFRSHAPATFEDFVWWTGLGAGDCRKGVNLLADELYTEKAAGREFIVHSSCRNSAAGRGHALLIAPYDEYLIGYKSRDVQLDPAYAHLAHNNSGNFSPILAHDGIVCGNWSPFAPSLETSYFDDATQALDEERAWHRYLEVRDTFGPGSR